MHSNDESLHHSLPMVSNVFNIFQCLQCIFWLVMSTDVLIWMLPYVCVYPCLCAPVCDTSTVEANGDPNNAHKNSILLCYLSAKEKIVFMFREILFFISFGVTLNSLLSDHYMVSKSAIVSQTSPKYLHQISRKFMKKIVKLFYIWNEFLWEMLCFVREMDSIFMQSLDA